MASKGPKTIYVDASPLLNSRLSGIGHLTLMTIKGLIDDGGYKIKLLVPRRKVDYISHWDLTGAEIVKLPFLARIWNNIPRLWFFPPIDWFIGKGLYIYPNFKYWPISRRSRSLTYIHDISFLLFPAFTEPKNLSMLVSNIKRWVRKTNIVITDSNSSKEEIIAKLPAARTKTEVVYCGVSTTIYKKATFSDVYKTKKKYNITSNYIMFLSNLEPRKNVERLLESLRYLSKQYKKSHQLLLVGGMSWNNKNILQKVDEMKKEGWGIIIPTTYVSDTEVATLISGADVLVHPAIHEGFGIPPLEAMACKTPVVVSDIAVLREVCGEAALYVNPYDPRDIAKYVDVAIRDVALRKELVKKGMQRAELFSWQRATIQLKGIIERQLRSVES